MARCGFCLTEEPEDEPEQRAFNEAHADGICVERMRERCSCEPSTGCRPSCEPCQDFAREGSARCLQEA